MLRIKIHDWRQYVTRTDLKSIPWVRVTSTIGSVRILHGSVPATRWLYIYLICEAARQNEDGKLDLTLDYVRDFSACTEDEIFDAINFLESRGILSCRYEPVTDPLRTRDESVSNPIGSVSNVTERNVTERKGTEELKLHLGQTALTPSTPPRRTPKPKVQVMDLSDQEMDLGTQWLKLAVTHFPHKATDPKWTPDQFAFELRKVANTVGLSIAQMLDLLAWVKADTFWCNKVASPYGLLKKSTNGLRKIENALASSKSKAQIRNEQIKADWEENPEKKASWELAMRVMRGEVK